MTNKYVLVACEESQTVCKAFRDKGEYVTFKSGKRMPKWYAEAAKNPKERSKIRSKTFKGIAEAMANQWGDVLR